MFDDVPDMSTALEQNREYAEVLKRVLRLRHEPVAVRLVREGEGFPRGLERPEAQMSHCQAVFAAKDGKRLEMHLEDEQCRVGASALGMTQIPEKVATGEFHFKNGMFASVDAAKAMVDRRVPMPKTVGEAVCPLSEADFVPDTVTFIDIPERLYWFVGAEVSEGGGHAEFAVAPFQCACEDTVAVPFATGRPNISLGCFGCRKKTDMKPEEMVIGVPYALIPAYVERFKAYETTNMPKAKRDRCLRGGVETPPTGLSRHNSYVPWRELVLSDRHFKYESKGRLFSPSIGRTAGNPENRSTFAILSDFR